MSIALLLSLVGSLVACAAPASGPGSDASQQAPAVRKHLVMGVFYDQPGLHEIFTGNAGGSKGLYETQELLHAGLSYFDDNGVLQPRLGEAVPSAENGMWRVLPDGRMETTWTIKPGVFWHDGAPFTADDLVFAVQFNRDREVGINNPPIVELIEDAKALDARTALVTWKSPFIDADRLFAPTSLGAGLPMPKHLLEEPFTTNKSGFMGDRWWREGFVGLGPYRLQEWVLGSHVSLVANDAYFLGRPKIDTIEVRFITDPNAMVANLLSGAIHTTIASGGLGIEQAISIKDQTDQINVVLGGLGNVLPIYPQFIEPNPPIIANVEFRRAILHGIDRPELNESLNFGLGQVAEAWLGPDQPQYAAVQNRIVRYAFDPRRSVELIQGLGYVRGPDGMFRDAAGQPLAVEFRATEVNAMHKKAIFPIADYWRRVGIDVSTVLIPTQRAQDRQYRSTYPGFDMLIRGHSVLATDIRQYHSSSAPLPSTNFAGTNQARYQNPTFDSIIERYVTTIPVRERMSLLGDILNLQTDQLTIMTMFHLANFAVVGSNRLKNMSNVKVVWNAHLWDMA